MRKELLHYDLPPGSVAQAPSPDRLAARLLEVPAEGSLRHRHVRDLPDCIPWGSLVVVNDTRVLRARLLGTKRGSGGRAEIFLVRRAEGGLPAHARADRVTERWWALGKASKGLRLGMVIDCGEIEVEVLGRDDERLDVLLSVASGTVLEAIERTGHVPLPPYIRREDTAVDGERYQTIFAKVPGAVAAPTAGLHLNDALVARLRDRECLLASVTLHVGLGTFQPVTVSDLDLHPMHSERYEVTGAAAQAIADARERHAPVVAIGTTVVRALETAADPERPGHVRPGFGETKLLIQPGYCFRVIDRLFTNFHLPESTLLALVCAFSGTTRILSAYAEARDAGYRFYSYGDATLLEPAAEARRLQEPAFTKPLP